MGYRHHCARVPDQLPLQPVDGVVVQMVRRLVQQQDRWRIGQQAGQGQPLLFTAGHRFQFPTALQSAHAQVVQCGFDPRIGAVAAAGFKLRCQSRVLRQLVFTRVRHPAFQAVDPPLQLPQPGQGGVDGTAHRGPGPVRMP